VGRVTIEGNTRSLCTGTLMIAPDTVVTAAHCVTNGETGQPLPFYKLNFVAGWHDGEHAGGAVASFIRVHADYADTPGVARPKLAKFAADLAVVTLKTPLLGVRPMPVAGGPVFEQTSEGWALVGVVVANTGRSNGPVKGLAVRVDRDRLAPLLPGS